MTKIVAIDFETANNKMASVCSVGIAVMEDGVIIDHYYSLIKPEENVSYFSPYNTNSHQYQSANKHRPYIKSAFSYIRYQWI